MAGLASPTGGTITIGDEEIAGRRAQKEASRRVAYVPQRAEMLLFRDTVREEIANERWLSYLGFTDLAERHPWTLSAGQRLWAALATAFVREPDVYLLDEPTRGLDPAGKDRLARILRDATDRGASVLLVTHDVELVARAADRVHLLAEGDVVASGPVREVLGESLLFSSQTSKVMGDPRFLTPTDVIDAVKR
jgi:energy-coupling factor transport system ATP-binding protein